MDEKYFDAKFEGLEKLMTSQQHNTDNHIGAVSANVKRVESDLSSHKESCEAHGRKSADGVTSGIVAWLSLAVAAVLADI